MKVTDLLTSFTFTIAILQSVYGDCPWYKQCNQAPSGHYQNCPYDGPGFPLNDAGASEILKRRCPEIYDGPDTLVCCDPIQIRLMDESVKMAEGIFGRCQTCMRNLLKSICAFTCSTDASDYLKRYESFNTSSSQVYVSSIDMMMNEKYMKETYESCKQTNHPSSGKLAMDVSCGGSDARRCTPQAWFNFMGDAVTNPLVPFTINYKTSDVEDKRFNSDVIPCNEAHPDGFACACVDCMESCPDSEPPQPEDLGFRILNLNVYSFIVGMMLTFFGLNICAILLFYHDRIVIKELPRWIGGVDFINIYLTRFFKWWGTKCAKHSTLTIMICSWVIIFLGYGITMMIITTDPVELWASPTSQSRVEKDYYDSRFGPFYRTEQIFIKPHNQTFFYHDTINGNQKYGPAFNKDFLREVFLLQQEIENLGQEDGEGLERICYAPITYRGESATLSQCTVQSVFGYYHNDFKEFDYSGSNFYNFTVNYLNTMDKCTQNPYNLDCLAPYGGPVEPEIALGAFAEHEKFTSPDYKLATAVVLTFLVNNQEDKSLLGPAMKWEKRFVDFLKTYSNPYFDFAYSAERSIEDGIEEISNAEIPTVVISYAVMFIYITIALGRIRHLSTFLYDCKITLATCGIIIVLASVLCSLGVFGYIGVATTMLTVEVIPFLVLAIGVDNIFIMVHTYNRLDKSGYATLEEGIGEAIGKVGPSILLTSLSECFCFAIGSLSDMPAVNTFAMYASVAIVLDFLFQITAFVALMAIDQRRCNSKRLDILCCVKVKNVDTTPDTSHGLLETVLGKAYAPYLLSSKVRPFVLAIFIIWTSFSIVVLPSVELGLDQELSMAKDSHVVKYFKFMAEILSMGPPVYWVLSPSLDYSESINQNIICNGILCNDDSVTTQLYMAANYPELTHVARPSSSWIDDYIDWLNVDSCCKLNITTGGFCPSKSDSKDCIICPREIEPNGLRPTPETFKKYIPIFLSDLPGPECAKAGRAAYVDGVNYISDEIGEIYVEDAYFMSYHTTLTTSKDFYSALKDARKVADGIQEMIDERNLNLKFFPYSIFYVFYEQYLTIWTDALLSLTYSLIAIFVVTFIVTGLDIISALLVVGMVFLIVINMFGLMWIWGITLNAVSLVNLVVSVGIGVEFVSHIIRAYTQLEGSHMDRAKISLATTGSSVVSGITLTKFSGIVVLAFAKSQIFQVFYFRMYLGIVLIGATHGLILLPIILSYFGPPSKAKSIKTTFKEP